MLAWDVKFIKQTMCVLLQHLSKQKCFLVRKETWTGLRRAFVLQDQL